MSVWPGFYTVFQFDAIIISIYIYSPFYVYVIVTFKYTHRHRNEQTSFQFDVVHNRLKPFMCVCFLCVGSMRFLVRNLYVQCTDKCCDYLVGKFSKRQTMPYLYSSLVSMKSVLVLLLSAVYVTCIKHTVGSTDIFGSGLIWNTKIGEKKVQLFYVKIKFDKTSISVYMYSLNKLQLHLIFCFKRWCASKDRSVQ